MSSRTGQVARNVLVRAIRQADRDGLIARNVAALHTYGSQFGTKQAYGSRHRNDGTPGHAWNDVP
jgi:hypothetical protein